MPWETEKDKARRTVSYVVDGFAEGYYYEDVSDPGIFPVYIYNPREQDYTLTLPFDSEEKAREFLEGLVKTKGRLG